MSKETVFPYKRWDQAAGAHREIPGRLATAEKIEKLSAERESDTGQQVDGDRVFDGWFVPREYKGHLLHVEQHDDQGCTIHIYGNDGRPARHTMKFAEVIDAYDEACKIIDHSGGR